MERGVCSPGNEWGGSLLPNQALGRPVVYLRQQGAAKSSFLSMFYHKGKTFDVIGEDVSKALKMVATLLNYPEA